MWIKVYIKILIDLQHLQRIKGAATVWGNLYPQITFCVCKLLVNNIKAREQLKNVVESVAQM